MVKSKSKVITPMTMEEFDKLSRRKRACIIAEDTIAQIVSKIYTPKHAYNTTIADDPFALMDAEDASTFIRKNPQGIKCVGCARASLFISAIKFKDKLSLGQARKATFGYKQGTATEYLSEDFSREQQALIECAYEGNTHFGFELLQHMPERKGREFARQRSLASRFRKKIKKRWQNWKSAARRPEFNSYVLIMICKNIIINNGTFKP